ncbi:arylamine N-acetyltransferase [Virgibacillus halophilus]|uniref:Arylamine N-acetyltransferase n=1 Tax=Tigheibacillus halophilus TaxID=361280 RepID=A0ABU5C869_9BACI|nr:arylamine N-acetyltransferase [Virgibacillus halophilus]
MDKDKYLQRIACERVSQSGIAYLNHLQRQHMLHVPFENLDVMHHVPIALDMEKFYEKVVLHHRGGFCYELNGLFHWLLQQLGFISNLVSATVSRPDGSWAKSGSHACIIVELDQAYIADVGFGDSARNLLPIDGTRIEDVSGVYRADKIKDHIYDVQRKKEGEWTVLYRVNTTPCKLMDFTEACQYNQTSPHSHFTQKRDRHYCYEKWKNNIVR